MRPLKEDFIDILESRRIKPVFQPIVSLRDGEIIGYEALSRIIEPKEISSSEELFNLAGIYGKVWELEQLCRSRILEKYYSFQVKENKKLFLNVNPMVIHDKDFQTGFTSAYLKQYGLKLSDIVFEVTEKSAIDDVKGFKDTIRHYKAQGYNIAVDDAGSCYSGLNLICDIVPHYLKLDMSLIRGIHKDVIKRAMVKSMVEFANLTNIQLIAEGIECEEELKTLLKLGVHNGQGYFLRKPDEELKQIEKNAIDIINKFINKKSFLMKKNKTNTKEYRAILFKFENYKAYSAYCEKYGDEKGDKIFELMINIVEQNLSDTENAIALGEDGVLTVLEKENYKTKCEIIVNMFRNRILEYYEKEERENGYIEGKNKHEESKKYPLISLCPERVV